MKGFEALRLLKDRLKGDEFLVSCNGTISREVYAIAGSPRNFTMLGSMGLATSIALGLAISQPKRRVIAIVGDGNMLMGLGSLATIGYVKPENLSVIVLDNRVYATTGNQETASEAVQFDLLAKAADFRLVRRANDEEGLGEALDDVLNGRGPCLLAIRIELGKMGADLVPLSPPEVARRVMSCAR